MGVSDREAVLALNLVPGLGPTLTNRCVQAMGSPQAVLGATARELGGIKGIGAKSADGIRHAIDRLVDDRVVQRELELVEQHNATVLTVVDSGYPRLLRHIPDPPPVLYVQGEIREDDALALAIVGTRRCTAYGREQADRFSALCAQAGLCIVSGGAWGVDAAAHRAAMRVNGRTIAVLGSGLAVPYPAEHAELFNTIAGEGRGAVVSELPMAAPPRPEQFPRRNRIISGLSLGTLVIEAPTGSGAMITARLAAEEHGREVMALPGRVDSRSSAGCHKMVREGWATLVTNAADVLDALGETGQLLKVGLGEEQSGAEPQRPAVQTASLTETQRQLVESLGQARPLDQLAAATGLPVSTIQADLTMLEIRGVVRRDNGRWRLRKQEATATR